MNKIFTLLAITFLSIFQGFAQNYVNYDRDSRWFIGANIGGTWTTQTEVPYRVRGGYGFTFGRSFGMQPDNIFAWDVRARFLHAQVQGQATNRYVLDSTSSLGLSQYGPALQTYQDSLGYFIPNYRTNLVRGSLELVLNTNRLRQNTGWNLSVFGGIGITGYHTAADLVDNDIFLNEPTYDYSKLNNTSASNVLNLQDGNYETDLVGDEFDYEVDWMPSFGFGISRQVHPAVAIGLEHKMTWTRTNLFDGMPNNFDGTPSTTNDMYHYTALTFKFHLFRGNHNIVEDPIVDDPVDPIVDEPVSLKKPVVDIYDPNMSPHTTANSVFTIKANVYYVDDKSGITFKQDGNNNTNFAYNPTTNEFLSNVVLHPGQNLFEITGVNSAGSDYESVIIVYQKEEQPLNPPIVTITNPPYSPYYSSSDIFGLVSTVLNVDTKSQIRVYLNGVNLSGFSYDHAAKVVNASLNLNDGTNTVTVTATNSAGSDSKTVEIVYDRPEKAQPPIVDFINPGVDPYYTTLATIPIKATAFNVATKSDLTVKLNGNPVSSFSFNVVSKEIYFNVNLITGANVVEIKGVNSAGMDMESTTIIYSRPENPQPPIVTFVDPNTNPITVYSPSYNVTAKVEHVASKSDITLKINGVATTLFSYSVSSDLMTFSTGLLEGSNVIEIKGVNAHGSDIETTTIIYKKSLPQAPPIVTITYPSVDNVVFESPNITLTATVLNVASGSDIAVIVNGTVLTDFIYNPLTKVLTVPLVLVEGNNSVQVTGVNMAGTDTKKRIIIHKKPIVPSPPTVDFINPPSSPHLVEVPSYTVTANTTHIDSKSQIVLKQNGSLIPNGSYSFVGGNQIIYNAALIPGSNVFEVRVENADGVATDVAVINFDQDDEPCIIPTVGYISPVPYSTVSDPNVTIDAQINNYAPGTTIELKLNEISQGYMTYDAGTSVASKEITLLAGSNAVNVVVTNPCGTNKATFTLIYKAPDAPCFDPVLTASSLSTFTTLDEVITLLVASSHVTDASELTVKLNGAEIPFTFDSGTGNITISDINLVLGSNSLSITAKTACGGAVLVYSITREKCEAPTISGISPVSGSETEASSVVLNATVANAVASDIVLLLNGVSQAFSFDEVTHKLSQALSLNVGSNTIEIQVKNACGEAGKVIEITRKVPCTTILTNLLKPTAKTVTVTEEDYSITLHTTGLNNAEQITAQLNGNDVPFTFDVVSGNIVLPTFKLIKGENTVVIGMVNNCSKSSVSYKITYNGCEPPVVIINDVFAGMTVSESIYNLAAVVTNVAEADDISLKVNDAVVDFDYNPVTHLLTAAFTLMEGSNSIKIEANGCEKVSASATIIYEKPCDKITHTLMTPNTTPTVSVESEFEITLSTFGVESAAQIVVKLNGSTIPFMFNPETKIITITGIDLIDGTNTVIVTMTNNCSSDVVNYAIIYDGCLEPIIGLGSNPPAVSVPTYSFEATVSNVSNSSDIQVLLNDAPVSFVFDPVSGGLNATVVLAVGNNTIRIIAAGCETATKDFVVNYSVPCENIAYTLGSPAELTVEVAESKININLVVQHVSPAGISVKRNGTLVPFTYADNILSINAVSLVDGTNTVEVNLSNACSSEKITYTILHDDCTTPTVDLSGNPLSTSANKYNFVGHVTGVSSPSEIELLLNGSLRPFTFDPLSGNVSATLTLIEGSNTIQLKVNGCAAASATMTVVYSLPCSPVTYGLVSPSKLISESDEESVSITLNTTNVSPETIAATLNGNAVDFTFSGGVITIPSVSLIAGSNAIVISFGNACSSETVTFTVNYAPCETPSVAINGLTNGMVLDQEDLVFYAMVYNVSDAGDILVRFNGSSVPFTFNADTHVLEAPLVLAVGSNTIEVIVNGCETVTSSVSVIYEEPCAPPTYTLVAPTETSATVMGDSYTITLSTANVTADQITVKVNGAVIPFTFSAGTIVFDVLFISVPTNNVEVLLTNNCGTAVVNYMVTYVIEEEDCVPTVSAIFSTNNKSVTANSDKDLINVILNLDDGSTQLITDVSGKTGSFSPSGAKAGRCIVGVWIRSGCNISAAGEPFGDYIPNGFWGGACEKSLAPCEAISHRLVSPKVLNTTTTVSPYSVILSVKNLGVPSSITAMVNGKVAVASFDGTRVTLADIALNPGSNVIQFTLSNNCSEEVITYTVSYKPEGSGSLGESNTEGNKDGLSNGGKEENIGMKVLEAPVISLINPSKERETTDKQTVSLKAKIENISGKENLKVLVNGNDYSTFNYSTISGEISAVIRLKPGANTIKIVANNGKTTEKTYYVIYEKQVLQQSDPPSDSGNKLSAIAPVLERVSPTSASYTSKTETYNVKTKALNVMSKADLTLTVNGVKTSNFTFSSANKMMSAVVRLKEGSNTVVINAKNGDKSATLTYTIRYDKPAQSSGDDKGDNLGGQLNSNLKPEFKFVNPSGTSATVKSATFVLKTKVLNVKSKTDLTLTINGTKVSNYTFNSVTGEMVATLNLKAGANNVRISAKNGNQVASISYLIKYDAAVLKMGSGDNEEEKKEEVPSNSGGGLKQNGGLRQGGG